MKSRWIRRLLLAALLALAVVALRFTLFRPDLVPVTIYRVAEGRVEDTVTNSKAGTVRTRHRAALSPEIGGRIEKLAVREGDRIEEGQVLIHLADADYRAHVELSSRALDAARAADREACLARDQAERDYARYLRLDGEQIVSEEILDQVRSRRDTTSAHCEAARAEVQQALAGLKLARVNLAKTTLRAPFDGVVTQVSTEVGEWITPSPPGVPLPAVIEVIDPDAIYVDVPLDEVDIGKVTVGLLTRITLDAFADQAFTGRVARVAHFVRDIVDQNRTFDVDVEFEDEKFARTLPPGTSADVEIILNARDLALRVPSYALMEGSKVLVLRDTLLVAVPVETGLRNWEFTEVVRGLEAGEIVIVSLDRTEVKEGAQARISKETLK